MNCHSVSWNDDAKAKSGRYRREHAPTRARGQVAQATRLHERASSSPSKEAHLTSTAVRLHNAVNPKTLSSAMPVLTIRNVPDDVYAKLKTSAAERRRSINSEAIECLRVALASRRPRHVEGFLDRARAARASLRHQGVFLDAAAVNEAKHWGRE